MSLNILGGSPQWEIQYNTYRPDLTGIDKIWGYGNPVRDKKVANLIYKCKFMTAYQIYMSPVWGREGKESAKNRLNYLSRGYYLMQHNILQQGDRRLPVYTVGAGAFVEDLKEKRHIPNFFTNYNLVEVLKILSVNQLFINLTIENWVKIIYGVQPPYTAEVQLIPKKNGGVKENKDKLERYMVLSVRNYEEDIEASKAWLTGCGNDVIAVVCNKRVLEYIGKGVSCRLIPDDALFKRL